MAAKKNILLKFIAVCAFLIAGAFAIQAIVTLQFMPIMGEILFGGHRRTITDGLPGT